MSTGLAPKVSIFYSYVVRFLRSFVLFLEAGRNTPLSPIQVSGIHLVLLDIDFF